MEKELPPPDSMTTVNMKPDYAPSETYTASEPPPAYQRPRAASVQVARIIAATVVLVAIILGGCILASAYITANASCRHLEEELQLLSETMDRYQPLQPEALVQEEAHQQREQLDTAETKSAKENVAEKEKESVKPTDSSDASSSVSSEETSESDSNETSEEDERPVHIKLPLSIDFDDLAGAMMHNQKSKMNCIVEKKHAVEVVDHQPKTVNLPFGLNLTTDPRYERVTGERISIFCESGNVQQQQRPQPDAPEQEETIMIQPMMIPLPPPQFHTHMAMQVQPIPAMHPMETMRPPMPNPLLMPNHPQMPANPQPQSQLPPSQLPPSQILHHIAQQIIAQKLQQEAQEEVQNNELRQQDPQPTPLHRIEVQGGSLGMGIARIPIPDDVLTQINRLPNRDVIVAVSQQDSSAEDGDSQDVRVIQHPRQSAQGMNGRQTYARGLPVDIPVPMMQSEQEEQEQEPQAQATVEQRPHYVHPRSVRSVDALLEKSQKRVKRCDCNCAC